MEATLRLEVSIVGMKKFRKADGSIVVKSDTSGRIVAHVGSGKNGVDSLINVPHGHMASLSDRTVSSIGDAYTKFSAQTVPAEVEESTISVDGNDEDNVDEKLDIDAAITLWEISGSEESIEQRIQMLANYACQISVEDYPTFMKHFFSEKNVGKKVRTLNWSMEKILSPTVLDILASYPSLEDAINFDAEKCDIVFELKGAIARHPNTSPETLAMMGEDCLKAVNNHSFARSSRDNARLVNQGYVQNAIGVWEKPEETMWENLMGNPNFPASMMRTVVADKSTPLFALVYIARNPHAPADLVSELYSEKYPSNVHRQTLDNPRLPLPLLQKALGNDNPEWMDKAQNELSRRLELNGLEGEEIDRAVAEQMRRFSTRKQRHNWIKYASL